MASHSLATARQRRPLMPMSGWCYHGHGGSIGRVDREIDEQLAMLCHTELGSGAEGLSDLIADLPRAEVDRLLGLAVVELMDCHDRAEKELRRLARRVQEHRR